MATKLLRRSFYRPHARVLYTGVLTDLNTGEVTTPQSRTKQEFVEQCDINNILKQFKQTGMVSHMSAKAAQGAYTDLPDPIEFQDSLNIVLQAETAFDSLPSKVRSRFHNNPEEFLAFMADPENQDEAIKLGLATDTRQAQADENGGGDKTPPGPPVAAASPPSGGEGGKPPS